MLTLGVEVCLCGVEVLGFDITVVLFGGRLVVIGGVAPADESDDPHAGLTGRTDREHQPVAEPVDDPAGRGTGAQAGADDLLVGEAVATQVFGEVGRENRAM